MYNIIVFSSFYKPHLGGVEKYVENFYKRINKKKILVVTSKYEKNLKTEEKDQNIDILRIESIEILKGKYYIPTIKGVKQIYKIFSENNSNDTEIHTHTRFYLTNFLATLFSKRFRMTHYHYEHGASFVKDGSLLVKTFAYLFDNTLGRIILRSSKLIYPISNGVKKFLENNFKNLRYGPTLYNSYDFPKTTFKEKTKPKTLRILFVGRLVKTKGIYELVDACRILKEKNLPFTLTIIGDGSEKENITRGITEGDLQKEISVRGSLPYEETQKEYSKHDLFVNPSYTEGLPTTVLEAVANSLLVVATDVGGTNEIIPKGQLIGERNITPTALAERIEDIYINWEENQKRFEKIYKASQKKFSWEENVAKYISL